MYCKRGQRSCSVCVLTLSIATTLTVRGNGLERSALFGTAQTQRDETAMLTDNVDKDAKVIFLFLL